MTKNILLGATAALLLSAAAAQALPITTLPPALIASGDVKAVYVFSDAGNTALKHFWRCHTAHKALMCAGYFIDVSFD